MTCNSCQHEIDFLKLQIRRLIDVLYTVEIPGRNFQLYCADQNITNAQENFIYDLLREISGRLDNGEDYNHHQFERMLREKYDWGYQTAKQIIVILNEEHRFSDVYREFKSQGMNMNL